MLLVTMARQSETSRQSAPRTDSRSNTHDLLLPPGLCALSKALAGPSRFGAGMSGIHDTLGKVTNCIEIFTIYPARTNRITAHSPGRVEVARYLFLVGSLQCLRSSVLQESASFSDYLPHTDYRSWSDCLALITGIFSACSGNQHYLL